MLKIINYKIGRSSCIPRSPQFGGIQGEHNCTKLEFFPDTQLASDVEKLKSNFDTVEYRVDAVNGMGEYIAGVPQSISDDMNYEYLLTDAVTAMGGICEFTFIISAYNSGEDGVDKYSVPFKIYFKDFPNVAAGQIKLTSKLDELFCETKKARDEAYEIAENLSAGMSETENDTLKFSEEAKSAANTAKEWGEVAKSEAVASSQNAQNSNKYSLSAEESKIAAANSAFGASNSANVASSYADTAKGYADTASESAIVAVRNSEISKSYANDAKVSANTAKEQADAAEESKIAAANSAFSASNWANVASSYASQLGELTEGYESVKSQLERHETSPDAHLNKFELKVDKIAGKELSSNDFTDVYKAKLDAMSAVYIKEQKGVCFCGENVSAMPNIYSSTLSEEFNAGQWNFYFVTLKDSNGAPLPENQFRLTKSVGDYKNAVNETFVLDSNYFGDGSLTDGMVVVFSDITSDRYHFALKNGGQKFLNIPIENSDFKKFEVYAHLYLFFPKSDAEFSEKVAVSGITDNTENGFIIANGVVSTPSEDFTLSKVTEEKHGQYIQLVCKLEIIKTDGGVFLKYISNGYGADDSFFGEAVYKTSTDTVAFAGEKEGLTGFEENRITNIKLSFPSAIIAEKSYAILKEYKEV